MREALREPGTLGTDRPQNRRMSQGRRAHHEAGHAEERQQHVVPAAGLQERQQPAERQDCRRRESLLDAGLRCFRAHDTGRLEKSPRVQQLQLGPDVVFGGRGIVLQATMAPSRRIKLLVRDVEQQRGAVGAGGGRPQHPRRRLEAANHLAEIGAPQIGLAPQLGFAQRELEVLLTQERQDRLHLAHRRQLIIERDAEAHAGVDDGALGERDHRGLEIGFHGARHDTDIDVATTSCC